MRNASEEPGAWLPEGVPGEEQAPSRIAPPRPAEEEDLGTQTSEWLVVPAPERSGGAEEDLEGPADAPKPPPPSAPPPPEPAPAPDEAADEAPANAPPPDADGSPSAPAAAEPPPVRRRPRLARLRRAGRRARQTTVSHGQPDPNAGGSGARAIPATRPTAPEAAVDEAGEPGGVEGPLAQRADVDRIRDAERQRAEAMLTATEEARRRGEMAYERAVANHQAELEDLRAEIARAQSERRDAEEHHRTELQVLTETLTQATESHRRAEEALRAEIEEAKQRLANAEAARDEAERERLAELERHRVEREQLTTSLAIAERSVHDAEQAYRRERESLTSRLDAAERSLRELGTAREAERQALESRLGETERALEDQRATARATAEEAAREAASYEARIAQMQRQLERSEHSAHQATERMMAATSGGKWDEAGRLELNTATIEGLRTLGLSITQAARIVARREAAGGFVALEQLGDVPGLPADQRELLLERLYVDPGLAPTRRS